MIILTSEGCFWPLTASMTSEVKKNHAHVYPYRNLRNFSEINFSIGPMVWPWIALWVHQDFVGLLIRYIFFLKKVEKVEKTGFFRANTQILKSECTTYCRTEYLDWDCNMNWYSEIHIPLKNSFNLLSKLYIPSTPNNSNETHTFMCLGRTGRFGQR